MKYYKLIAEDNTFIGAVNSKNFIRYSPVAQCFVRTNEELGEYLSYEGKTYRSAWMRPIVEQKDYISIFIIEINESEYQTYIEAIENNETINIEEPTEEYNVEPYIDPNEVTSINFIRASKINEMSYLCRTTIEAGFNLELRGETHHFSLTTQDQLNLMSLSALAQTQDLIPYHADGEECTFYTSDEINIIMQKATELKIYNTTYYNALKAYINSLETIEEISAITYGIEIPEEFQSDVLKVLGQ